MRMFLLILLPFMYSCAGFTPIMDDVESMMNNDAITIKCDKDTFQKNTDLHINIDVVNKDPIK